MSRRWCALDLSGSHARPRFSPRHLYSSSGYWACKALNCAVVLGHTVAAASPGYARVGRLESPPAYETFSAIRAHKKTPCSSWPIRSNTTLVPTVVATISTGRRPPKPCTGLRIQVPRPLPISLEELNSALEDHGEAVQLITFV